MLSILRDEGWDLKERELTKLRKDNDLLLREPNRSDKKRKRNVLGESADQNGQDQTDNAAAEYQSRDSSLELELPPEIIAKREARQARLLAESEERLRAGTRRRRTKVWSGLPPDPDLPPRYPSELTMEECKRELGIESFKQYQEMRDIFEDICRTNNVVKKTLCGADTWKAIKEELIGRFPHLQPLFWGPTAVGIAQTRKPMALDLICMDVTKRIRTFGSRITIADAKNILGITPQEGRDVRSAFDAILKGDHFVSKLEVPKEHWEALKFKWIDESPKLREILAAGDADPDHAAKLKSLESIACDVQKRHRDYQTKRDPSHIRQTSSGDIPPPYYAGKGTTPKPSTPKAPKAPKVSRAKNPPGTRHPADRPLSNNEITAHINALENMIPNTDLTTTSLTDGITTLASQALAHEPTHFSSDYTGMQIDPTLLEAAALPQDAINVPSEPSTDPPIAVYFRLSPASALNYMGSAPRIWLDTFTTPYTVETLRVLALNGLTLQGKASVRKIEGVAGGAGNGMTGGESKWGIDEDDELEAYLGFVKGGGKATFVVEIS